MQLGACYWYFEYITTPTVYKSGTKGEAKIIDHFGDKRVSSKEEAVACVK